MSNWINVRNLMGMPSNMPRSKEPRVDEIVSKLVGKKVFTTDPTLLKWVGDKIKNKDPDKPLQLLKSAKNRQELKKLYE